MKKVLSAFHVTAVLITGAFFACSESNEAALSACADYCAEQRSACDALVDLFPADVTDQQCAQCYVDLGATEVKCLAGPNYSSPATEMECQTVDQSLFTVDPADGLPASCQGFLVGQ